jgi:hypothetical protein
MDANQQEYRPGYGWAIRESSRWGGPGDVDLIHVTPSGEHSTTCSGESLSALLVVITRELARVGSVPCTCRCREGRHCGGCGHPGCGYTRAEPVTFTRGGSTYVPDPDGTLTLTDAEGQTYTRQ